MEEDEEEKRILLEINRTRKQIHEKEREYEGYKSAIEILILIDGGDNIDSLKSEKEKSLKVLNKLNQNLQKLIAQYAKHKTIRARENEQSNGQTSKSSAER